MSVEITPMGIFWFITINNKEHDGLASLMEKAWEEVKRLREEKERAK